MLASESISIPINLFYYGLPLKRFIALACIAFLASCSSVPLSSMIKMAALDQEDIVSIDPSQVRVRLSITDPVELQTKNVRLALKFDFEKHESVEYEYLLEIIDVEEIDSISNWFSSEQRKHAYQFKLASLSQLEFNKLQRNYASFGKPERYQWTVYYYLKSQPRENESINIDMELKLSSDESYFFLLKNAPVIINAQ